MSNLITIIHNWLNRPCLSEISNAVSYGDQYELNAVITKWTNI